MIGHHLRYVCFGWGFLLSAGCVALELKMTHRYGPEMCESLEKRGCNVTFHRENLTCVLHDEKDSSGKENHETQGTSLVGLHSENANKSNNRQDGPVGLTERGYPRLFVAGRMGQLSELDWATGRTQQTYPVDKAGWIMSLACSDSERKVYFLTGSVNKYLVWSIGTKGEMKRILEVKAGRIAVDDQRHHLFLASLLRRAKLWRYELSKTNVTLLQVWVFQERVFDIEVDPGTEVIFLRCSTRIYSVSYEGNRRCLFSGKRPIYNMAYDRTSEFLYFGYLKDLYRIQVRNGQSKQVLTLDEKLQPFDVHQNLLFVRRMQTISAIDLKSNTPFWSRPNIYPASYMCVLN